MVYTNFLLMKHILKNTSFKKDFLSRNFFFDNEIFFTNGSIIKQSKFSQKLSYLMFKRNQLAAFLTPIKNRCIISGYSRSVNSKLKLSRHSISQQILNSSMTGFYRSV
jgi:ribosomal protein S14